LLLLVRHEGRALGYLLASCREGRGFVESLYLEPECRGLHLGESLMRSALDWMRLQGAKTYGVHVAWGHESVFGFYEKFGFYPIRTELERRVDAQNS
jgi:ribosomal protein S18 acetylase RimI-like enzyme